MTKRRQARVTPIQVVQLIDRALAAIDGAMSALDPEGERWAAVRTRELLLEMKSEVDTNTMPGRHVGTVARIAMDALPIVDPVATAMTTPIIEAGDAYDQLCRQG